MATHVVRWTATLPFWERPCGAAELRNLIRGMKESALYQPETLVQGGVGLTGVAEILKIESEDQTISP